MAAETGPRLCYHCGKGEPKFACGACREAFYCCASHQKLHWKIHRECCCQNERDCAVGQPNREPTKVAQRRPVKSKLDFSAASSVVERQQRSREERTKEKRGETVLERRLGERISGLRTRVEDTDDAVRVWNGHRAPDEVAAEYYGAIGKGAQDVDQRMRGYLRAALEAMETSESRIMDAFAAWNAQHLAADSLLASMISGEERSRPAFESEGEAAEAYVRWGEAARKILAEEAVRWVRSGAASGAIPADCAAEVLKHFAGEDPTATPEARAEQNKFEMENLGREAAMMSAATLGGRSYMVSRQARGGPDDAAAPATRVSESAKSAPFQFLTGDPRRDALLSESEGAPGPSLSADSDWASVGDARGAQPAPGDMLEQGGAVRLDAEEAEKREMRMREALGLIAEAERIYESKVAAGDESARAPAAEARELARRLATSPSQFLDSRKVEMLAVSAIAGAVLFGGVGALAYAFDVLGTRGLTEKMASTFARAKEQLGSADARLGEARAEVQRIRAEVGDTIASTARAGEKMTRVEELAAQAEQYDDEIHRLASGLAASACTEDEIAANINRCAAATLQVIGESHARLAQGGSAFAELSAGIAAKCEEVLHAFNQTGYVSRANAKWLAENLMSPRVRDTLNQIANRSGAAKVRLFFKVLQNPLLKLPKEGLARCRAETDAASAELRRISERLASLDPRLATAVEDLKAGMASVENADAYVDRFKKAADDFVARAGDVTAFQSLRSALQARFPGQNNLIEYLMTKVEIADRAERVARNARRDLAYATKTGGLGGALSIVSTALFGILSLRDAARSAASVASVLELVRLVFKWPGTKLWDLGTRMYEFGRGVDPMIEDADAAIRTARAIQAGEAVTDTDYEMMKREQARIVAQLGRTSMPARCAAVVGGSALLGAGAVLRGCALAARSAAYPMRLLTHAGNVSMAFAAAGGWFSEGVRAARALAAEGQVAPGLAGGFAYISSPASTLRDVLYFLKDAAWPAAVTLYEFVAGHVWGLTGAAAMIATGGAVLAYLLRDTRVGERALAAFRSYRYMRFGLGTTWNVVSSVSTLYSLFFAVPICWPIAIPVSVLVVGSSAWKLHKSLETLREAGGGSGSENKFVGGKNDDEDEYMPTVEGDVIMVDSLGNPISREDAAQFMLDLRRFAARRAAEAAEYLNVNRDTVFAEEALKLVTDSAVDVRELSQDEIVMRRIRTEFALAPLRPPFPSPARLLSMRQ